MLSMDNLLICYNSLPLFADHVLDYPQEYYKLHGVERLHNHEGIDPSQIKENDVVCIKTDFVENGYFYNEIFPKIKNKFKLVTTISSLPGPIGQGTDEILSSEKLIAWYPCHVNPKYGYHEKVFPVPIGFTEPSRQNGNQHLLQKCREEKTQFDDKKNSVLLPYHNLKTNKIRRDLVNSILKSGIKIERQQEKLEIKDCLKQMDRYKYVVCLEGSGIDTHRAYECLLMDCVPIMKKTPLHRIFDDYNLPGIFIESWDEIDENFVESIEENQFDFLGIDEFLLAKTHGERIINEHSSNVRSR